MYHEINCPFYHTDGYEVEIEYDNHYDIKYLTYRRVNCCEILNEEIYCCGNKDMCKIRYAPLAQLDRASDF